MTVILGWLKGFGRFWYGFIVGDDWTVAATVAAALVATWLPPLAAVVAIGASLGRAGRATTGSGR